MSLNRAVGYFIRNERRRAEREAETVQETASRRRIRNVADSYRRSKRVCIRIDDDVEEHDCGTMSEVCVFCGALALVLT